jgi:hypothetical protein
MKTPKLQAAQRFRLELERIERRAAEARRAELERVAAELELDAFAKYDDVERPTRPDLEPAAKNKSSKGSR